MKVAIVAALQELHFAAFGPLLSFVEKSLPIDTLVLDREGFERALRTSSSHYSVRVFGGVFGALLG